MTNTFFKAGRTRKGQDEIFKNTFHTRKAARHFCRARQDMGLGELLFIVTPDGEKEPFERGEVGASDANSLDT